MGVDAVICCRVAPKQKAFVVKTVRQNVKGLITAAIGDGANDVAMIQEAHVGIGIRGVEGTQAVQASDFAISQFRFLQNLFLDHGRSAYRRVGTFIGYYFYKNIALCMVDALWTNFCGYSGQIAFPEWLTTSFNAIWTSFPCIILHPFFSVRVRYTFYSVNPFVVVSISRSDATLFSFALLQVFFPSHSTGISRRRSLARTLTCTQQVLPTPSSMRGCSSCGCSRPAGMA